MWMALHAHPFSAVQRTPVAWYISIYRLHGMENPNCRRINELKKLDYSIITYAASLTLASAYLEFLP